MYFSAAGFLFSWQSVALLFHLYILNCNKLNEGYKPLHLGLNFVLWWLLINFLLAAFAQQSKNASVQLESASFHDSRPIAADDGPKETQQRETRHNEDDGNLDYHIGLVLEDRCAQHWFSPSKYFFCSFSLSVWTWNTKAHMHPVHEQHHDLG